MTVRLGLTLVLLCDGIFTVTSSNPRNPVRYINTFWYFINSAVTDILWLTSSVGSCSLGKCKMWRERLCILSVCTHHWSNNYHFYYHDILESVTLQVIAFFYNNLFLWIIWSWFFVLICDWNWWNMCRVL